MEYDFDLILTRRDSDSIKWSQYGKDVLPLWVADMDFRSPAPILQALHARVDHGIFGYAEEPTRLKEIICERMDRLQGWAIDPDSVLLLPGLVCGLNVVSRCAGEEGDGVLVNTPVYPPFLTAPTNQNRQVHAAEQRLLSRDGRLYYEIDMDRLAEAVGPETRVFLLCNPQNPVGRVYSREELLEIARFCEERDLLICSDEIHCDLLLEPVDHVSIAALGETIASRTLTLLAPSKTFNLPGLGCSIAVIPDSRLRMKFKKAMRGIVPEANVLGMHAAVAAYTECSEWRKALLEYLRENRDFLLDYIQENLPGIRSTNPEATYLAWLDCRELGLERAPYDFFLEEARVALNDGRRFGTGGEGFVRINFGCPRAVLEEALERMKEALLRRSRR